MTPQDIDTWLRPLINERTAMQEFGQRKFRGPRGEALAQKIQIVVDLIVRIEGLVAVYDRTHHATFKAMVFNWVEHHIEELHTMMRNYRETTKTEN